MDWYPHYIDEYDADTLELTLEHDGAYCRLLRWYYKNERALPKNDAALAAICRVSVAKWQEIAPTILQFFVTRDSHVSHKQELVHKRCNKVIAAQTARRRDATERQKKHRKYNVIEPVTRDSRVSHVSVTLPEDRIGEDSIGKESNSSLAQKPSRRKTPIPMPSDYQGTENTLKYAHKLNLTDAEHESIVRETVAYWTDGPGAGTRRGGWEKTVLKRINARAATIIKARTKSPAYNRPNAGSIISASREILAALGAERTRASGGPENSIDPGGAPGGFGDGGTIIDADEARGLLDATHGA